MSDEHDSVAKAIQERVDLGNISEAERACAPQGPALDDRESLLYEHEMAVSEYAGRHPGATLLDISKALDITHREAVEAAVRVEETARKWDDATDPRWPGRMVFFPRFSVRQVPTVVVDPCPRCGKEFSTPHPPLVVLAREIERTDKELPPIDCTGENCGAILVPRGRLVNLAPW